MPGNVGVLPNEVRAQALIEIERIELAVTETRTAAHAPRTPNAVNLVKDASKSPLLRVPSCVNRPLIRTLTCLVAAGAGHQWTAEGGSWARAARKSISVLLAVAELRR